MKPVSTVDGDEPAGVVRNFNSHRKGDLGADGYIGEDNSGHGKAWIRAIAQPSVPNPRQIDDGTEAWYTGDRLA